MIYDASKYVFDPPPLISRAHKILIKPSASYPHSYPFSTSREILGIVIDKIKQVSDADIIILEGTASGESVYPIYKSLGYDFQRVLDAGCQGLHLGGDRESTAAPLRNRHLLGAECSAFL